MSESAPVNHSSMLDVMYLDDMEHYFADITSRKQECFQDDAEYMKAVEYKFLLKNLRELSSIQLYQAYSRSSSIATTMKFGDGLSRTMTATDIVELKRRVLTLDGRLADVLALIAHRLSLLDTVGIADPAVTSAAVGKKAKSSKGKAAKAPKSSRPTPESTKLPRIVQFCRKLSLSPAETDLFHLMVVNQGSTNSFVLNSMVEEDYLRRIMGFQRLCNMSEIDIELFCDGERLHIKEGLVLMEEDNGQHFNLRVPRTAVAVFYGKKVGADDLLKLSQTTLEAIIQDQFDAAYLLQEEEEEDEEEEKEEAEVCMEMEPDGSGVGIGGTEEGAAERSTKKRRLDGKVKATKTAPAPLSATGKIDTAALSELLVAAVATSSTDVVPPRGAQGQTQRRGRSASVASEGEDIGLGLGLGLDAEGEVDPLLSSQLSAYDPENQLEYLEEGFKLIALMVRGNAARLKDDMKKEGTRLSNWEGGTDVKHGKRELLAKLKVAEKKVSRRVALTKEAGVLLPRLELLTERLGLDSFEKKIILLLVGKTVSPVVRTLMDTLMDGSSSARTIDDVISVGQALAILCQDFQTQVACRRYFYRSSRLLTNGIISLSKPRWHQGSGDLTDQKMAIDRRLLDWCVGLDSEINELVEGSDLYKPRVTMSQIVLPPGELDAVVLQCKAYDEFCRYRVTSGMSDRLSYGSGLVILFCGKSGTGKTMTVNAIANELGKSVLLVDFGSLTGKREGNDIDADLRGLFREAHMSNAVLFFDECETVFRNRNSGGDRMLNALLTEIEKHEGIVFLATNRPYDLDEAMHRRINSVVEFRAPDAKMRREIWRNLLCMNLNTSANTADADADASATEGSISVMKPYIKTASDVDVDAIAVKYELTGGFIKNAVISATLAAISRSASDPVVCHADVVLGCKLQMRGSLTQRSTEDKLKPTFGLANVDVISSLKLALYSIIRYESTRACVYGSWGADASAEGECGANVLEQRACLVTFAGPRGSGKRTLVNCVAHELERNVKIVHFGDLLSERSLAESMANLEGLLRDARLGDSLFCIDGFETILDDSGASGASQSSHDSSVGGHSVGGFKLQSVLARMLTILCKFPGLIVLVCHVDNPQSITLQRDFASSLYSFIRFTTPPAEVRAALWKRLLPPRMPVFAASPSIEAAKAPNSLKNPAASNPVINFTELGKRFELNPGNIRSAVARACAEAASRITRHEKSLLRNSESKDKDTSASASASAVALYVAHQDMLLAGEAEVKKLKGSYNETLMNLFV